MVRKVILILMISAILVPGCIIRKLEKPLETDPEVGPAAVPYVALEGHDGRVIHVEFAPRSNRLVSLSEDGVYSSTIIFWDGGTGEMVDSFTNVNNADMDVEFSPNGDWIGLGSRTLFLLNSSDYRLVRTFEPEVYEFEKVVDIEFWDYIGINAQRRYTVEQRFRRVTSVSFSSDVRYVASGHENGQIKIWEIKSGDLLNVIWATKVFGGIIDVEFSPDGRFIAGCQDDERLKVWRFPDYRESALTGHERAVYSIDFDPLTGRLLSAGVEGKIYVWDIETGKVLYRFDAHDKAVMSVAVTEDGRTFVTGSKDNTVRIWEMEAGRRIAELPGHGRQVNSVAVNSNATLLASGSDDGTVRIWDISGLGLSDNIALTPEPVEPARLDGTVWFEDESGDGVLSAGESGRFNLTISNEGGGAAYNIVTLALPDTLGESLDIENPGVIPMLLPGRSAERVVAVSNSGEKQIEGVVFTFRILESNGFHLNPPLKASIVRIDPR